MTKPVGRTAARCSTAPPPGSALWLWLRCWPTRRGQRHRPTPTRPVSRTSRRGRSRRSFSSGPAPLIEGGRQYGAAFLPAAHQGTFVSDLKNPINNLKNDQVTPDRQRRELDTLRRLNDLHGVSRTEDSRLSARIESFELAYRM